MSTDYSYMDNWSNEQVEQFKEEGFAEEEADTGAVHGILGGDSDKPLIIAEGDSWCDYKPGTDLVDCLRKHHGYRVDNYSKAGDTLENMIYGVGYDGDFARTTPQINKVLEKIGKKKPAVFLFSGGGNDIAGDEFASFLNHKNSGLAVLRREYVDNMIRVVFKKYFEDLLEKVSAYSPTTEVIVHGYAHTNPTGKGVKWWFFRFAGPWLRPALTMKGVLDTVEQRTLVDEVIDAFNEMLSSLSQSHERFHHVDLRPLIDRDIDWSNELHLRNSAYAKAAEAIHTKVRELHTT